MGNSIDVQFILVPHKLQLAFSKAKHRQQTAPPCDPLTVGIGPPEARLQSQRPY